jgi:hypothetical protein
MATPTVRSAALHVPALEELVTLFKDALIKNFAEVWIHFSFLFMSLPLFKDLRTLRIFINSFLPSTILFHFLSFGDSTL